MELSHGYRTKLIISVIKNQYAAFTADLCTDNRICYQDCFEKVAMNR
jgi:hypothetical protein